MPGVSVSADAVAGLQRPELRRTLDRLHRAARADRWKLPRLLPRLLVGWARGRSFAEIVTPGAMQDVYISVPRGEGEFLYLTARAVGARRVVEFGSSFGISTLYLAAAVRENGGGSVVGSEIEPTKQQQASANLKEAGLDDIAEIRLGDALETLRDLEGPVDLVFLDGWKDLYLPVLELLTPRLRPGSVVLADNIYTFRAALRPYVERMQAPGGGFESTTLRISDGVEYSVYRGSG